MQLQYNYNDPILSVLADQVDKQLPLFMKLPCKNFKYTKVGWNVQRLIMNDLC